MISAQEERCIVLNRYADAVVFFEMEREDKAQIVIAWTQELRFHI